MKTYVKLLLTAFFWAAVFHLGKYAINYLSPLSIAAWRFILAAACLLPVVLWRTQPDMTSLRRNVWPLLAMGVIGVFGFNASLFYGLRLTSPVNAALIMAFNPAITVLLATWISGEKTSGRQRVGFALSLAGVMVIVSHGSLQHLLSLSFSRGDLLIFIGNLCWAAYSVIPRRFVSGLSSMMITTATIAIGAVVLALTAQTVSGDMFAINSWPLAVTIVLMAVFGSVLAYVWWNQGIATLGASRASIFINIVPMFTMLIGIALGQMPSSAQVFGAVLVITGVLITVQHRRAAEPGLIPTSSAVKAR